MKTAYELWEKLKDVELVQVRPIEMQALIEPLKGVRNPLILEVGSAHGASSIIFAETVKAKQGFLICIDSFPEDYYGQEKFGEYARKAFKKNVLDKYRDVLFLDMTSESAIEKVKKYIQQNVLLVDSDTVKTQFDLLFLDGDHSYEAVKKDCELYLPLLRSGGYVGFHDYNNPAFGGVKQAADEYCSSWGEGAKYWDLTVFRKP